MAWAKVCLGQSARASLNATYSYFTSCPIAPKMEDGGNGNFDPGGDSQLVKHEGRDYFQYLWSEHLSGVVPTNKFIAILLHVDEGSLRKKTVLFWLNDPNLCTPPPCCAPRVFLFLRGGASIPGIMVAKLVNLLKFRRYLRRALLNSNFFSLITFAIVGHRIAVSFNTFSREPLSVSAVNRPNVTDQFSDLSRLKICNSFSMTMLAKIVLTGVEKFISCAMWSWKRQFEMTF